MERGIIFHLFPNYTRTNHIRNIFLFQPIFKINQHYKPKRPSYNISNAFSEFIKTNTQSTIVYRPLLRIVKFLTTHLTTVCDTIHEKGRITRNIPITTQFEDNFHKQPKPPRLKKTKKPNLTSLDFSLQSRRRDTRTHPLGLLKI